MPALLSHFFSEVPVSKNRYLVISATESDSQRTMCAAVTFCELDRYGVFVRCRRVSTSCSTRSSSAWPAVRLHQLSSPGAGSKIPKNMDFFSLEAISRCSISFSSRSSRVWALSPSSNSSLISRRPSCVSCFSLITSSSILTRVWPSL